MRHKTFEFMSRGKTFFAQRWWPDTYPKAVVIFIHTWAGHSSRHLPLIERLTQLGYACYGFDFMGHGHTQGKRAYIPDFDYWLADLTTFIEVVHSELRSVPFFLHGYGVGATAAANYVVSGHTDVDGIIFNSGALAVGKKIAKVHIMLAWIIGRILPIIPIAPLPPNTMSTLADKQQAYDTDPLIYHGQMAAGTGKELLMASMYISQRLHKIAVPFLALQGRQDTLVTGSEQLYQQASSSDKTLKSYDALHDLLNDKTAEQVITDIIEWLEARVVVHH
ncbi:alpha/beta fold hydrolase [uncultured Agitococcus sp.]|uniref:alpha/beta fold hydrolase n=1 Tax=uncultured Agitococcus sp. TaxID=1506599 RepID=UPI002619137D|nr:alpha/beta fold hydrolase [uncultured Agitococcus sp.]